MSLIADILQRIFDKSRHRLAIVTNRDGFLLTHRDELMQESGRPFRIVTGTALDLRLVKELDIVDAADKTRYIFVPATDFPVADDVAAEADILTLSLQTFFPRFQWAELRELALDELEWLYARPLSAQMNASPHVLLAAYRRTKNRKQEAVDALIEKWRTTAGEMDFRRPAAYMRELSEIVVEICALNRWKDLKEEIRALNERFQKHIQSAYPSIEASALGNRKPQIVSQVARYVDRQHGGQYDSRAALIVVDGMAYWQAVMLAREIGCRAQRCAFDYHCIYSWLPSVTELSRQALFRGDRPVTDYNQSPALEARLWEEFWTDKRLLPQSIYYQHGGEISAPSSATARLGYVCMDLDNMMHSAATASYLYDDTRRWVSETPLVAGIAKLLEERFTVYLTSDHGNIETTPYRPLSAADRVTSVFRSNRAVTLADDVAPEYFEQTYKGHFCKVEGLERTYFAKGTEQFSGKADGVSHGGTHFLEVLVPFITIKPEAQ